MINGYVYSIYRFASMINGFILLFSGFGPVIYGLAFLSLKKGTKKAHVFYMCSFPYPTDFSIPC